MAFPLYKCDSQFPDRIIDVLREQGFTPQSVPLSEKKLSQFPEAFSFRIKRGLARIRVFGCEENGQMEFYIVFDRPVNPLTWRPSAKISRQIEKIMLQHGAQLIEQDELD